jgi:hypothetical protein
MEERKDKREERVEDLEVRKDEAGDVAGGKRKDVYKIKGKKASGKAAAPGTSPGRHDV